MAFSRTPSPSSISKTFVPIHYMLWGQMFVHVGALLWSVWVITGKKNRITLTLLQQYETWTGLPRPWTSLKLCDASSSQMTNEQTTLGNYNKGWSRESRLHVQPCDCMHLNQSYNNKPAHLHSILGEDEGFHGGPGWVSGLLGSILLKHIHLFEYLHLLVNALYVLQTHSDPSSDIQEVKISGDFIISLSALHSSPNIRQFGLKLLLLTVPLNFSLSLCCHSNQVGRAGERLKQKAHVTDSLLTHPPNHTQVNSVI